MRSWGILASGLAAVVATHFAWLRRVGGWQYDEGWAANHAYRIAYEPGFWPVGAMASYTCAWSHYVAAAFFRIFGARVFVYRASGIVLALAGIALLTLALWRLGEKKTAVWFPAVVAFFPTLVMNHRWVIEETTFFVFCCGLVCLGLVERARRGPWLPAYALIVIGALLGVTSHAVFLGSVLALWTCLLATGNLRQRSDQVASAMIFALLIPFYLHTMSHEAEFHDKAEQLVEMGVVIFLAHFIPDRWLPSVRVRLGVLKAFTAVSCIALVPFLVYGEGSWLALFANGYLETRLLTGTIFIPVALAFYFVHREKPARLPFAILAFIPVALFIITVMVGKPGPRYYEIPYLAAAALFAWALGHLSERRVAVIGTLWIVFGALQLGVNYFPASLGERQIPHAYRFFRFHDASFDNLPILRVARRLAAEGCQLRDLNLPSEPERSTLSFLAHGDWPAVTPGGCRLGHAIRVERRGDAPPRMQAGETLTFDGQYVMIATP